MLKEILIAAAIVALPVSAFAKETSTSLKYSGWHCAGCAGKVEAAVKKVDGVKKAKVTKDTITVTYDDAKADVDKIKLAVASTGDFKIEEKTDAPKTEAPKTEAPKTDAVPAQNPAPK